ncbi:MAG: short chain dehydrogenase, partial [Thermoleophilaceae bacterium]|nr:short chain dehydrogenase [Thermoleophilaceae bacterium]
MSAAAPQPLDGLRAVVTGAGGGIGAGCAAALAEAGAELVLVGRSRA